MLTLSDGRIFSDNGPVFQKRAFCPPAVRIFKKICLSRTGWYVNLSFAGGLLKKVFAGSSNLICVFFLTGETVNPAEKFSYNKPVFMKKNIFHIMNSPDFCLRSS